MYCHVQDAFITYNIRPKEYHQQLRQFLVLKKTNVYTKLS